MEGFFSYFWMILQTLLALGIVCGIAFILFRVVLPKLGNFSGDGDLVTVVERVSLETGKSFCVVESTGKYFLVGVSDGSMNLITELDANEVKKRLETKSIPGQDGTFAKTLASSISGSAKEK